VCALDVRILGISGSPLKGNTEILVKRALESAKQLPDVTVVYRSIADMYIAGGCKSSYACKKAPPGKLCVDYKDDVNDVLEEMVRADGIIIGSPVYFGRMTGQLSLLLDRTMALEYSGPECLLWNKVGGAITIAWSRHGGQETTVRDIERWFMVHKMIPIGRAVTAVQGPPYEHAPNPTSSADASAVLQDSLGLEQADVLGKRVAQWAKVVKCGFSALSREDVDCLVPQLQQKRR